MGELTFGGRPLSEVSDDELIDRMCTFTRYRPRQNTLAIWLAVYRALDQQGPPMTVRGLFYALEMLGLVPKSEAGYRAVAYQVLQMRRLGMLPYNFIADGTRWVRKPTTYSGLQACLERTKEAYRRALWDDQPVYVEIWCEKDAVAGVLLDVTDPWDVPLYVCRGYSSETFTFNAAETLKAQGKPAYIYYVGDLDPSGWNISESIQRRLSEFGARFTFKRLAITPEQVDMWQLPTRLPKPGDTRAKNWKLPCVEVDALPANRLRQLCEQAITAHIDPYVYEQTLRIEAEERRSLEEIAGLFFADRPPDDDRGGR